VAVQGSVNGRRKGDGDDLCDLGHRFLLVMIQKFHNLEESLGVDIGHRKLLVSHILCEGRKKGDQQVAQRMEWKGENLRFAH
jgi:hypothetical protein